jgi:hypothetical protein
VGPVLRTRTEEPLDVRGTPGSAVRRDDVTVSQVPRPRTGRKEVTVLTELDEPTARMFWELYAAAFGPLRTRAAARQVLHEQEFLEEMVDPRVWKYVIHDVTGQAVGLTTLTATMLDAVAERVAEDRAVCGYDICAFNNEAMRFDEHIETMLNRSRRAPVERLDSQTYYVADLSEA